MVSSISNLILEWIVKDLGIGESSVRAVLSLLAKGGTVPFIARYRKEATGNLDEVQIRAIGDKFAYYAELESRKSDIIRSIESQGRMNEDLRNKLSICRQKFALEDLYLPYKQRERTNAMIAREKGLEPLADIMMVEEPVQGDRSSIIGRYVNPAVGVATSESAVTGAIEIIAERVSEDPDVRSRLRDLYIKTGVIISKVTHAFSGEKTNYEMYYSYSELIHKVPSHRMLAIRRGAKEKVLSWEIEVREDDAIRIIIDRVIKEKRSIFHTEVLRAIDAAYRRILRPSLEVEVFRLKMEEAEREAIGVFSKNLANLLLAPPAGHRVIMGVDPGIATGAKLVVIGENGELKESRTVFLHGSVIQKKEASSVIEGLIKKYKIELIAVGNGTASKETFNFINNIIKNTGLGAKAVVVSEAGASVYSASDTARFEFPDLDVTMRGAVSIARRLQDPLADLVKIDPKSIGVGQYQHDVNQKDLKKALDATVESCVNYVGVDLNTASAELLSYIAGFGTMAAQSIVAYKKRKGPFKDKRELLKVPLVGEKAFEQAAGFLKIRDGVNPLDNTTIHPERYELVDRMARDMGMESRALIGNEDAVSMIDIKKYISGDAGLPTLEDIIKELKKPGLDPRREFEYAEFSSSINSIEDISVGMQLNGVVTNVANFGAFVDIGIHQDGLIHISRMGDRFIKDPHEVISVGDKVKVKIVSIDKALDRIGLEMLEVN
ncbi:MAG: RNA-binding transcriptional accessory protein [Candidatus Omnitrophica bacterium]|nr:RNA-binding transcriptional accessory protein [Candidatus Omnitrophota bacterium]